MWQASAGDEVRGDSDRSPGRAESQRGGHVIGKAELELAMAWPPEAKATSEIRPWIDLDQVNLDLLFVTHLNLIISASDSLHMAVLRENAVV